MKKILKPFSFVLLIVMLVTAAHADDNAQPVLYGQEQLTALLDNLVSDIQPGTAGSSLRATARAAELLKWGMNTEMTEDDIQAVVKEIIGRVPEDGMEDFKEALSDVQFEVEEIIIKQNTEMLRDAGIDPDEYDFTGVDKVEAVDTVFSAAEN